ncbi:MAG: MBL fold metallo-hydrolase, partial [Chitinophagales bacterium]
MKIKFCGAAGTVTGSSHLITLDDGFKILLDCGLYQGNESKYENFNYSWAFNPAEIDVLILSHAHIDHCGRIP